MGIKGKLTNKQKSAQGIHVEDNGKIHIRKMKEKSKIKMIM